MSSITRLATIAIAKEYLKFSAAHFTIFSASERERVHGHNFTVAAEITAGVDDNGMTSNYRVYKNALKRCCEALDEYVLLPGQSPYMTIAEEGDQVVATFAGQPLFFPKADTIVMPIRNTTVEEFSHYILQQLLADPELAAIDDLVGLSVTVASGPGQTGTSRWLRDQ